MTKLTHVDEQGNARMVDVADKPITDRLAIAEGWITIGAEAMALVLSRTAKKGDVLATAQLAGIQGAKRASDLIPLCHPLPLTGVERSPALPGVSYNTTKKAVRRCRNPRGERLRPD